MVEFVLHALPIRRIEANVRDQRENGQQRARRQRPHDAYDDNGRGRIENTLVVERAGNGDVVIDGKRKQVENTRQETTGA